MKKLLIVALYVFALVTPIQVWGQSGTVELTVRSTIPDTVAARAVTSVKVQRKSGTNTWSTVATIPVPANATYPLPISQTFTGLAVGTMYTHRLVANDGTDGPPSAETTCGKATNSVTLVIEGCEAKVIP